MQRPRTKTITTRQVARAVSRHLGGEWRAMRATRGWTKRTFFATDGRRRAFVKFDVRIEVLERLGEIGVGARVVAGGEHAGRTYVIQEVISGRPPGRTWFARDLGRLAELVALYQRDEPLAELLRTRSMPALQFAQYVADRASRLTRSENAPALVGVATRVAQLAPSADTRELVPTHGDPNASNFVVRGSQARLVDWDDAALTDPMRDVGQLLWWYVAEDSWSQFFERYGVRDDSALRDRLYWWVAAESLDVALQLTDANDHAGARDFLTDAAAALAHRPNPRA